MLQEKAGELSILRDKSYNGGQIKDSDRKENS